MEKLSLKEKIGQMLIVGLESNKKEEIEKLIKKLNVGGVVIYRKNYQNYKEMINFVNLIKETNQENKVPIIISVDQEGGRVNRMPDEILNLKSATKIAKAKNVNTVKMSGNIIGQMLNETGISMDYAPILDIKRFGEGQAIGDRCYGENKEDVEKYAIEVMKQLQENHVIPVVKHFPGHGLTKKDSHFRIPKIEEKIEVLEKEDMHPFEVAIENGADAIMVGHLSGSSADGRKKRIMSMPYYKTHFSKNTSIRSKVERMGNDSQQSEQAYYANLERCIEAHYRSSGDITILLEDQMRFNEISTNSSAKERLRQFIESNYENPWSSKGSSTNHHCIYAVAIKGKFGFLRGGNIAVADDRNMDAGIVLHLSDEAPVSFARIHLATGSAVDGERLDSAIL